MLTNKQYKRNKQNNKNDLIKAIIFAATITLTTAFLTTRCNEVNAMDEESTIEKIVNEEPTPYCLHKGLLQYQSIDRVNNYQTYCSLSESRCPYYHREKNKEYCNAEQKIKKKGF